MSQLAFRLAQSYSRAMRPTARVVTRAAIGSTRLQSATGVQHVRLLTQRASLQSLQLASAPKPQYSYHDDNMLLASPSSTILPLGDLRDDANYLHYMQTGKTVTEQLSVMQNCLINGNTEQAQRILMGMYQLYPQAMREVVDVSIHNEILNGLLSAQPRPLVSDALHWYDVMENQYKVSPNSNTFAILISGFVNSDMQNVALAIMQEMLRSGYSIHGMLLSSYLSDEAIRKIEGMAQEVVSRDGENVELATMLLSEVKKAEDNISALTAEASANLSDSQPPVTIDTLKPDTAAQPERKHLESTNVAGIKQLQATLESLYQSELQGYNLQIRLENDTYDAALARYREINAKRNDPLLSANISALKKLSASWLPKLEALIEEEQQRCQATQAETGDHLRGRYGRFFTQLSPSKMATVTILETLRLNVVSNGNAGPTERQELLNQKKPGGIFAIKLISTLSKAIHNEIRFEQMKKRTNRHVFGNRLSLARLATSGKLFNMAVRRAKMREYREQNNDLFLDEWTLDTQVQIGSLLVSMLLEAARIPEHHLDPDSERLVPAFKHEIEFIKGRRVGIVAPHAQLRELFKDDAFVGGVHARHLPMLVPPRPWLSYNAGGYLTRDEPCMRLKSGTEQMRLLKQASNEDRLGTVLAGLDALGLTRWAINRPVFEAVRKVWNSGRELAEIPARSYDELEPVKPDNYDSDAAARYKYQMEMREWVNGRANQHSQRCDCNYKIEIAQAFLDHPMYFPHNMDFRGRAYPIPPHFNHLGNDLCRGLLMFDEGRPLTDKGLYWLKIHLANLFGKDKLSHDERIRFVEENVSHIMAIADDPMPDAFLASEPDATRPWWLDAENPWQALAACIDYAGAMRSPHPAEYVSHLHIHQDGTCNGLQHYAAMGRDRKGAEEVNLAMSERPQDVYSGILRVAERLVDEDAKNGVEEALQLQNKLTRKIVKQTVMTNVYGVTLIGAKEQIAARLREIKDDAGEPVFDITKVHGLALYLARKIFDSLGEMFAHAQEIQNWLNESARRIANSMSRAALAETVNMATESKRTAAKLREAIKEARKAGDSVDQETLMELRPDLGPGATRRKRLDTLASKPMTPVAWTTPLGMTVLQPYRKMAVRRIATDLQNINIVDPNMPTQVNPQKQKTAFPPNFVHSLDASHMVLSAIECKIAGLVFASVHDSYWTHACDVDKMNTILRDQFVRMHTEPIMERLKAEFEERYSDHMLPVASWDYVNSFSFEKNGALKAGTQRLSKTTREQRRQLVETELARLHLETCEDTVGEDMVQQQITANDAELAESMEPVDLTSIELVDSETDPVGAARQADLIAYTTRINAGRIRDERKAIMKEHRERVSRLRSYFTRQAKAAKAAKAERKPRKKFGSVEPTVESAEPTSKPQVVTEAGKLEAADLDAINSGVLAQDSLDTYIETLKLDRDLQIDRLQAKYPTKFDRPLIISLPAGSRAAEVEQLKLLIKQGKLAGRLVKSHRFDKLTFDDLPAQGDFNINEVLQSPYFFS